MKITENFILKEVSGQHVIFTVENARTIFNGMIQINKTSAFLFNQLSAEKTKIELIKIFSEHYGITIEQATNDVELFLEKMLPTGAITFTPDELL